MFFVLSKFYPLDFGSFRFIQDLTIFLLNLQGLKLFQINFKKLYSWVLLQPKFINFFFYKKVEYGKHNKNIVFPPILCFKANTTIKPFLTMLKANKTMTFYRDLLFKHQNTNTIVYVIVYMFIYLLLFMFYN